MKYAIAISFVVIALFSSTGCASDSGADVKETKTAEVKVDIPKEKQDEIAQKFKEGNFSKK